MISNYYYLTIVITLIKTTSYYQYLWTNIVIIEIIITEYEDSRTKTYSERRYFNDPRDIPLIQLRTRAIVNLVSISNFDFHVWLRLSTNNQTM